MHPGEICSATLLPQRRLAATLLPQRRLAATLLPQRRRAATLLPLRRLAATPLPWRRCCRRIAQPLCRRRSATLSLPRRRAAVLPLAALYRCGTSALSGDTGSKDCQLVSHSVPNGRNTECDSSIGAWSPVNCRRKRSSVSTQMLPFFSVKLTKTTTSLPKPLLYFESKPGSTLSFYWFSAFFSLSNYGRSPAIAGPT